MNEKEVRIIQVRKRDGSLVLFDQSRITNAILRAMKSINVYDVKRARELSDRVVVILEYKYGADNVPGVEDIQDIVEKVLIKSGEAEIAKAYILYRQKHREIREAKKTLLSVADTISEYLDRVDWRVRENSNEDYSFSGLLLYTAGKVIANYALSEIYTKDISEAHNNGYIHIHDLGHGFIGYCSGWSLKNLLLQGFGGVPNKADAGPPKHMDVVIHQMINFIGCLQMEFAGAQAFNSADTLMAPFVKTDNLSYKEVKQNMQKLVFSLNIPSRFGSQYPFSNLTFDWKVPKDMENEKAIVGGKQQDFTYGDCQKEMDMINKAFLEVMHEGDYKGSVFTFPIPTYNLTRDFDWDSENANILFKLTAKYGLPYFQNYIGSNLDPSSIRAMCCRLNLNMLELINRPGGMWSLGDNTGSLGVVTINVNRLAYESKDKEEYFKKLDYYMNIAKNSLEIKRKIVENNLKNGLMPYAKVYLGTFNNHFSTIGLCGMNEACLNLLGEDIATKEGKKLAIETLEFMRDKLKEFQEETGNLYNLEATPAEGASYRLARLDKKMYPKIITSGENVPYLTNSTNLPVNYTEDLVLALKHQNDIQPLYTGGTIFHVFLGERIDAEICKKLVKKIALNTKLPYFNITPTFSVCSDHGYLNGEVYRCPKCEKETNVYSRVVGYIRPVKRWNDGKQEEFKQRKTFDKELVLKKDFSELNKEKLVGYIK